MADDNTPVEMKATVVTEMEWVPSQPEPDIYANHVNLGMTLWDLTVNFGLISGIDTESNHLQVAKRVSIHLAPETARALQMSLEAALERYENTFGKLRFPNPAFSAGFQPVANPDKA
jgi:hypothetical protein